MSTARPAGACPARSGNQAVRADYLTQRGRHRGLSGPCPAIPNRATVFVLSATTGRRHSGTPSRRSRSERTQCQGPNNTRRSVPTVATARLPASRRSQHPAAISTRCMLSSFCHRERQPRPYGPTRAANTSSTAATVWPPSARHGRTWCAWCSTAPLTWWSSAGGITSRATGDHVWRWLPKRRRTRISVAVLVAEGRQPFDHGPLLRDRREDVAGRGRQVGVS